MRWVMLMWVLLVGCGPPPPPPPPGTVTVTFQAAPVAPGDLVVTSGSVRIDHIDILGDVPPPGGHPMPPPPVTLDLLATSPVGQSHLLRPGLYSALTLNVDEITVDGTWRGQPLHVHITVFGGVHVFLRSETGHELQSGGQITFPVTVDPNAWFAGNLLDTATISATGELLCDQDNNLAVAMELVRRIDPSMTLP